MKRFLVCAILLVNIVACRWDTSDAVPQNSRRFGDDPFLRDRLAMVDAQINRRGVADSLVLNAMRKVPRHEFVPAHLKKQAYIDSPLPIGEDQTISQPYIVGFMTECLSLTGHEKVLEIGTGSGYQAAVLAEIVDSVFTIEIVPSLGQRSRTLLHDLGYKNIHVRIGDGYQGWPDQAPFDAIIVTAAPGHIPQPLIDQLKPGGRMIIPVGDYYQELVLLTKNNAGEIARKSILPVRFVPMTGEALKRRH
ncbi:MAG: protein-L-isoaspartate(D-aspartate) O-methyltransferase [Candidatus Zhuqueibacterota bacterium]